MTTERRDHRLVLTGVSRSFDGVHAVEEVSITVRPGTVLGLVGPNGSGKTTVVNIATGAVAPDTGTVVVDGTDLAGQPVHRFAAAGIVRSYQNVRLFEGIDVLTNVMLGAQRAAGKRLASGLLRGARFRTGEQLLRSDAMKALDAVGMADQARRPVGALSHGQRRRVELARAFAAAPRYLVVDEPGAGVATEHRHALMDLIAERAKDGTGVLLVEHDLFMIERLCTDVVGMAAGRVVASGSLELVRTHPLLSDHLAGVP